MTKHSNTEEQTLQAKQVSSMKNTSDKSLQSVTKCVGNISTTLHQFEHNYVYTAVDFTRHFSLSFALNIFVQ